MSPGLHISGLYRYPVKSMAGEALPQASVDALGLAGDRRWMLTDAQGRFLSQRDIPHMATVHARLLDNEVLRLAYQSDRLRISPQDFSANTTACRIWKDTLPAHPARPAVNETLSQWLETPVRLVKLAGSARRQVDTHFVPAGVQTGFSDGFPLLILSQASLDDLNRRIGRAHKPFEVRHFRPNVLIDGCDAYAEDRWQTLRTGPLRLHLVKPCSRCTISTVDPDSGCFCGPEPLATLAAYRRRGHKVYFGQNAWAQPVASTKAAAAAPVLRLNQAVVVEKTQAG